MRLTSAEVVIGILAAVYLFRARAERRRFHREAARDRDRTDRLDALIRDARDWPHESYAWGPGADEPVQYLPADVTDFDLWKAELEDQR